MAPATNLLEHLRRLTSPPAADVVLLSRWIQQRDEAAFAALVSRHGPMVLGVCQRILGDAHEAEDAFQATFLVLARKASSLRRPETVACWLHGVAARLARKYRSAAQRRAGHSRTLAVGPADSRPDPLEQLTVREMLGLIDSEIRALREVYRLAVVLCDLEGRTQEEAAQMLGWSPGSLRGRLLRGRARLKARLARRGLALPAGIALPLVPAAFSPSLLAADPVVTAQLISTVTQAAGRFSIGSEWTELSSPAVELAREGVRFLTLSKVKLAATVLLTTTIFVAGAGLLGRQMWPASGVASAPREEEAFGARTQPRSPDPKPAPEKPRAHLDRFGDSLPEGAVARLGTVRFRHGARVRSVAFSPDGKTLASGGNDNTVRFWEIATGKEIRRFTAVTGQWATYFVVDSIAFSPDGKLLAAGTENGPGEAEVVIWTIATGKVLHRFSAKQRRVHCVAFGPDGKTVAAGVDDLKNLNNHPIRLWDVRTGKLLRQLKGQAVWACSLAFSPDGRILASTNRDKTIRLWAPATGRELRRLEGHTQEVYAVAFSRDGKTLASASIDDDAIRLWDPTTGKELRSLKCSRNFPTTLAFLPDNKTLASSGVGGVIRLWDTATGEELRHLKESQRPISSIAVSPNGKLLSSGGADGTVHLWDLVKGEELLPTEGHRNRLWSAAITPDAKQVATGGDDGAVRLWEADSGKEIRRLQYSTLPSLVPNLLVDRLCFSSDGKTVSATTWGYALYRWETATGKVIFHRSYEDINVPRTTPDAKYVVGSGGNGAVHLVDAVTGREIRQFKTPRNSVATVVSPDGKLLAAKATENEVAVWELATGKERCRFKGLARSGSCPTLVFSPDSKYLAAAIETHSVRSPILIWDAATGREIRQFLGHDHVLCLAFSPDGRTLASGGLKTIRLWETVTGKVRRDMSGHQGYIRSLAFSADGTRVVSASDDTTALVWDASAPTPVGKPTAERLQAALSDLAGDDAAKAYRAVWLLARNPKQSVPLLYEHARLIRALDRDALKQVEHWIADLDSDEAPMREKASRELEKRVVQVEALLRKALSDRPSLEKRKRIERVLDRLERERVTLGRVLEVLESAQTPESRQLLETLAAGDPDAWLTQEAKAALTRLSGIR
jgi:RNA polymerase sigma factor (sigma-70 family)